MWLIYYFHSERNYDVWKSKSPCFLLNKNINLIKTKWNRKWKIPQTVLKWWTMCFSLFKNCELKVKLWWAGARKIKKSAFFVVFILSEENFFNICVWSQCIVYWINCQNIHTFTYLKALLHTLLLLVFKIVESLPCILNSKFLFACDKLNLY